jgi:hypothetical protein
MKGRVSSSRGFAYAYSAVTAAFVLAWFAAPVDGRTCGQTGLVVLAALASTWQIGRLWLASIRQQRKVDTAWETMFEKENREARTPPDAAPSPRETGKPDEPRR